MLRLKAKNEEKQKKAEIARTVKELEDEEKKEKMVKTMNETMSKLNMSLDLQKVDNKRRAEMSKKRQEETKLKHEEMTAREMERR